MPPKIDTSTSNTPTQASASFGVDAGSSTPPPGSQGIALGSTGVGQSLDDDKAKSTQAMQPPAQSYLAPAIQYVGASIYSAGAYMWNAGVGASAYVVSATNSPESRNVADKLMDTAKKAVTGFVGGVGSAIAPSVRAITYGVPGGVKDAVIEGISYYMAEKSNLPVKELHLVREWKRVGEEYCKQFDEVRRLSGSDAYAGPGQLLTGGFLRNLLGNGNVSAAIAEFNSLEFEIAEGLRTSIRIDLPRLKLFENWMDRYVSALQEQEQAQAHDKYWADIRDSLIDGIRSVTMTPGWESIKVPDQPADLPLSTFGSVRKINLGIDSPDVDCLTHIDLSGKGSPPYQELTGLMFWMEMLPTNLAVGSSIDVYVSRSPLSEANTTVVTTASAAATPKAAVDLDHVD